MVAKYTTVARCSEEGMKQAGGGGGGASCRAGRRSVGRSADCYILYIVLHSLRRQLPERRRTRRRKRTVFRLRRIEDCTEGVKLAYFCSSSFLFPLPYSQQTVPLPPPPPPPLVTIAVWPTNTASREKLPPPADVPTSPLRLNQALESEAYFPGFSWRPVWLLCTACRNALQQQKT